MAVKIQVKVFWVVMPHNAAVGHQCFGGPCCYPEDGGSKILWRWYPTTTPHSVTIQKPLTWIFTTVKTSNLARKTTYFCQDCDMAFWKMVGFWGLL